MKIAPLLCLGVAVVLTCMERAAPFCFSRLWMSSMNQDMGYGFYACPLILIPSILVYDLNPRQVVLQIGNSYFNAIMLTVPG